MKSTNESTAEVCRVCSWKSEGGLFDVCACCGTQCGYEDLSDESIQERRTRWIESGYQWFDPTEKPRDWKEPSFKSGT